VHKTKQQMHFLKLQAGPYVVFAIRSGASCGYFVIDISVPLMLLQVKLSGQPATLDLVFAGHGLIATHFYLLNTVR